MIDRAHLCTRVREQVGVASRRACMADKVTTAEARKGEEEEGGREEGEGEDGTCSDQELEDLLNCKYLVLFPHSPSFLRGDS